MTTSIKVEGAATTATIDVPALRARVVPTASASRDDAGSTGAHLTPSVGHAAAGTALGSVR